MGWTPELEIGTRVYVTQTAGKRLPANFDMAVGEISGHGENWDLDGRYYFVSFDVGYNLIMAVPVANVHRLPEGAATERR